MLRHGPTRTDVCHPDGMDEQPEHEKTFTFSVNASGLIDALWKLRASMLFSWHPELTELDDQLDILYRGQI